MTSRSEWLATAQKVAASPRSATVDPLVGGRVWAGLASVEDADSFIGASTDVSIAFWKAGRLAELGRFLVWSSDVWSGFAAAGPADASLMFAIHMTVVMDRLGQFPPEWQRRIADKFAEARTTAALSREALELLRATMEDRLLGGEQPGLAEVRNGMVAELNRRAPDPNVQITYEPLGRAAVSTTGRFQISSDEQTLSSRLRRRHSSGEVVDTHRIRVLGAGTRRWAACLSGVDAQRLAVIYLADQPFVMEPSPHPGIWLRSNSPTIGGLLRIMNLGPHGCIIADEWPAKNKPPADTEAFLLSIKELPETRR